MNPLIKQNIKTIMEDKNKDNCSSSESVEKVAFEICLPFLLAGFGMVLAGTLLDYVQYWPVFTSCPQLFILVPALLGLKVNTSFIIIYVILKLGF
jgi:solute carrier family 41